MYGGSGEVKTTENAERDTEALESNESKDLPELDEEVDDIDNLPDLDDEGDDIDDLLEEDDEISDIESEDKQELTIEEKQAIADNAAQEYNESKRPYERAKEKGIEGVKKTENGGVSFAETDKIYTKEDGTKCIVKVKATGNRSKDFEAANEAMGLDETPEGYVWHHVDDYNVEEGTITLELVEDEAHNMTKPHSGGCAQYDAVNGASYNPPRKGE